MRPGRALLLGLLGSAAIVAGATGANAGQMSYSWTGFHIGGGGGFGIVNYNWGYEFFDDSLGGLLQINDDDIPLGGFDGFDFYSIGASMDMGGKGAIGTIEAGFDVQVGSHIVFGVFGDYTFSGVNSNVSLFGDYCLEDDGNPDTDDCSLGIVSGRYEGDLNFSTGNSWSIGARAGFLANPATLIFGTLAYTNTQLFAVYSWETPFRSESFDLLEEPIPMSGISAGIGVETMLSRNLSAKLEYRGTFWRLAGHYDSGAEDGMDLFASSYVQTIRGILSVRFPGQSDEEMVAYEPTHDRGYSWTGLYIGAGGGIGLVNHHAGYELFDYLDPLFADNNVFGVDGYDAYSAGVSLDHGGKGAIGTVEFGVDGQIGKHIVVGLLADYTFANIASNHSIYGDVCLEDDGDPDNDDCSNNVESGRIDIDLDLVTGNSMSVGGRAGLLATPGTLIYGMAAYTRTNIHGVHSWTAPGGASDSTSSQIVPISGISFGVGIEAMVSENMSAKLEYRSTYWSLAGIYSGEPVGDDIALFDDTSVQTVRGTLSLRFGADD